MSENLKRNLNEFTKNEEFKEANLIFNTIKKKDDKNLTIEKKLKITNLIKEDKILWINILNFKKVDFMKIKDLVAKNGIIVESKVLKDYLNEQGIICLFDK